VVEPTVTARGTAVVLAVPDESEWTLVLTGLADEGQAAMDDVAQRARDLSSLLDELGVPLASRSTSAATITEELDHVEGRRVSRGFRASVDLTVRVCDPVVAATMVERAVGRCQAQVHGPTWVVALDNPARGEACRQAAREARHKAAGYAEALGLRLGPVLEIRDADAAPTEPRPMGVMRAVAYESSLEISPGRLQVGAAVDVTFRLEG
jgi:uncharacterized protein